MKKNCDECSKKGTCHGEQVSISEECYREQLEDALAENKCMKEIWLKGCDCGPEDACKFARERDAALAKIGRLESRIAKGLHGTLLFDPSGLLVRVAAGESMRGGFGMEIPVLILRDDEQRT